MKTDSTPLPPPPLVPTDLSPPTQPPPPDPVAEVIGRIEGKVDDMVATLGNLVTLLQEERAERSELRDRVAALEAVPPRGMTNGHG